MPNHEIRARERLSEIRDDFPCTRRVKGTLYHGYAGTEFKQDDFYEHTHESSYFGPALYLGSQAIAQAYADYHARQKRTSVKGVVPFTVDDAIMLDIDHPFAAVQLEHGIRNDIHRYLNSVEDRISREPRLKEQAAHIKDDLEDSATSLMRLVSLANPLLISYFVDKGIEGVKGKLNTRVGINENVYAFWTTESISDPLKLRHRQEIRSRSRSTANGLLIGRLLLDSYQVIPDSEPVGSMPKRELLSKDAMRLLHFMPSEDFRLSSDSAETLLSAVSNPRATGLHITSAFNSLHPAIAALSAADVGVWEGYTLDQHTQSALNVFNEGYVYKNDYRDIEVTASYVRLVFLLQDIGKPLGYAIEGHTKHQQLYNRSIAACIVKELPISSAQKKFILNLASQNIIGEKLHAVERGKQISSAVIATGAEEIAHFIEDNKDYAKASTIVNILRLLHIFDAAAYTKQAWYIDEYGQKIYCKEGLDRIFKVTSIAKRFKLTEDREELVENMILGAHQILYKKYSSKR